MKVLIAYDGSLHSKSALRYGLEKLRDEGGSAVVLHVFHSAMFVDYGAGPNAENAARREAAMRLGEAKQMIADSGVSWVRVEERDGIPEEEILGLAEKGGFDVILTPARYKSISKKAPCPVIMFPGSILVPVDDTENSSAAIGKIISEAKATGSRVVLMGLVPVHMYGPSEEAEVGKVEKETLSSLKGIAEILRGQGIETTEVMRFGYPDEEILKAMEEFSASMIIIPTVEEMPSELSKAASIILDETEKSKRPVLFVPSSARA